MAIREGMQIAYLCWWRGGSHGGEVASRDLQGSYSKREEN